MSMIDSLRNKALQTYKDQRKVNTSKPLKVAIMGQTGTGKSSLTNALFGTNLKTDPVRPCTKEIESVSITNKLGHQLLFYDMPGIGESMQADRIYMQSYIKQLIESDVVLWTLHADVRSLTFDSNALAQILGAMPVEEQSQAISKIVFVLTKADLLTPPAWMLVKVGHQAKFVPVEETQQLMAAKAEYCRQVMIDPYNHLMISTTYNDGEAKINESNFICDETLVRYKGAMTQTALAQLTQKYPQQRELLTRLYQNYQVVPISSLFRYNLNQLFVLIVNRLGEGAIHRFQNFYEDKSPDYLAYKTALSFTNLFVYDPQQDKVLYDLRNVN